LDEAHKRFFFNGMRFSRRELLYVGEAELTDIFQIPHGRRPADDNSFAAACGRAEGKLSRPASSWKTPTNQNAQEHGGDNLPGQVCKFRLHRRFAYLQEHQWNSAYKDVCHHS